MGCDPPMEWKTSYITPIYNKGIIWNCTKYKGINVICSVAWLYAEVIKNRIEEKYRDSGEQNGLA